MSEIESSVHSIVSGAESPSETLMNTANAGSGGETTAIPVRDEIVVDGVAKTYVKRRVVDHVSLNIRKGEIVGLLGPNGAGKTTTFYMVVGLVKPDEGSVRFNGKDISQMSMYQRARLGMGYLPQEPSVFRKLSVRDNINVILENIDIPDKERKERMDRLLNDLDIGRISDSMGYALSGGERRRVEIARALAAEPSFILLDEPFAGVDPIAVQDIQTIILQLQRKGLGLLITDHNVRETLAIVDRAYIMNLGKILVSGTADVVAKDETARKFYLGDRFQLDQIQKEPF
ncbi:MAG: LPS export ABC transporter ATP-binding protein [Candidatus Ozemobacteraceae bacterium]